MVTQSDFRNELYEKVSTADYRRMLIEIILTVTTVNLSS